MKLLHTADWHLDAPMAGFSPEPGERLRRELRKIPDKIARLCKAEGCDLLVIAGDIFDGPYTRESMTAVRSALAGLDIPVVITPGNHDPYTGDSPYQKEEWPSNVHIFTESAMTPLPLPELNCRIYGAAFTGPECPGLLKSFRAEGPEQYHIGVLHGEVSSTTTPYCPIAPKHIQESGLTYLALGHIHKQGSRTGGETLCIWPGCPMGRGFDELGAKGVVIAELDPLPRVRFVALDTPRFYDEEAEVTTDPVDAVAALVPALPTEDFYRITLTGYCSDLNTASIANEFPHVPNLILRDETVPEVDLWSGTEKDTLEGSFFALLRDVSQSDSAVQSRRAVLAAHIARKILDGQEVKLP